MPTRHNDALTAHLTAYERIASAGMNRNHTIFSEEVLEPLQTAVFNAQLHGLFPDRVFNAETLSFELAVEPEPEEIDNSSEELDNFLKEFALKEVC